MTPHILWSTAVKDLRRRYRDPIALLLWLGIPLAVGSLILLAVGGSEGASPTALLLVADQDDSFLSNLLANGFSQATDLIQVEPVSLEEGRKRLDAGDGSALLLIPEGFGEATLKEEPTELRLWTNPSQSILPAIIEESLEVLVDATFYTHRVLGEPLAQVIKTMETMETIDTDSSPVGDEQVAEISVLINQSIQRLQEYIFPPVIELETSVDESSTEGVPMAVLFFPGILLMALLFMAQGLSEDVWLEREQGTLRRMISAPPAMAVFLAGKLLAGILLIVVISLIILLIGMSYLSLSMSNLPLALVLATASGTVFVTFMLLLQLHASSQKAGAILTSALVFPLLMLGGSFFPSEVMPAWMAAIGRWTPNGWTLEQIKDVLLDREDPTSIGTGLLFMTASGALLFAACIARMRRSLRGS